MIEGKAWTISPAVYGIELKINGSDNDLAIELSNIMTAVLMHISDKKPINIKATAQRITDRAVGRCKNELQSQAKGRNAKSDS